MNHQEASRLCDDYVDRTLPLAARHQFEGHLAECAQCRGEVDQLRALLARAADLPAVIEPARDLWPGIRAAIADPAVRSDASQVSQEAGDSSLDGLRRWLIAAGRTRGRTEPTSGRWRPGTMRSESWRTGPWRSALALAAVVVVILIVTMVGRHSGTRHVATRRLNESGVASSLALSETVVAATLEAIQIECRWADEEVAGVLPKSERDSPYFPVRELIQQHRRIIDLAIVQTGEAWQAHPQRPELAHVLAAAYLARAGLERQEARLAKLL